MAPPGHVKLNGAMSGEKKSPVPWAIGIGPVLAVFGLFVAAPEQRGMVIAIIGSALLAAGLIQLTLERGRR